MARWYICQDLENEEITIQCSECKTEFLLYGADFDISVWPKCPKCEAKMDGGKDV